MFEFEKQIMKAENRYPLVGYHYKVIPKTDLAKLFFAKFRSEPHRVIPKSEMKRFIEKNLNLDQEPFTGIVKMFKDEKQETKFLIERLVIKKLSTFNIEGIEYTDDFGGTKRHVLRALQYEKDFTIEIGEKIVYEHQPKGLTFDDIKAL